jgi:RNA polymerase sigma-70 factor (ECF subfamily)
MPRADEVAGVQPVSEHIAQLYRSESRRVFATLIRMLGDFDLAEEGLHEAFKAAVEQWPQVGVPANPFAWLVSAGRFRAIDQIRKRARLTALEDVAELVESIPDAAANPGEGEELEDDRLRLIFTCCHPSLSAQAQVALTLREVCGLTTEEIARAFLTPAPTLAQRIVRAKAKIRDARIPYQVPERADLSERLQSVLQVIYLVFNEGYSASAGDSLMRHELSQEAIRLARLLLQLLEEPEIKGLLALMLLHESRRAARTLPNGDLIPLDEQHRGAWNAGMIVEGSDLVEQALRSRRFGPYSLQAAISAVHAQAQSTGQTDWPQIVGLYDALLRMEPSPVIELNRAVAIAMRDGPQVGLPLVDALLTHEALQHYHLAHAARADLCRRLGRSAEARTAYARAMELTAQLPEKRYLARRLAELGN